MRETITAVARVFLPAYASAVGWMLAGIGWGVLTGAVLEAIFGRDSENLLEAVDGTALAGVGGALCGMVATHLAMIGLLGVMLIPLFAYVGKVEGRYPPGQEERGLMVERSARSGAVVTMVLAVFFGLTLGAMCGVGLTLESVYGESGPTLALHWGTALGTLAGGVVGFLELARTLYRALSARWQHQLRPGLPSRSLARNL